MPAEDFDRSGFVILPAMLGADALRMVDAALQDTAASAPAARQMLQFDWCAALAENLCQQLVASSLAPADAVCVQCTCFEKSRGHNWLVAPHQDLSIPLQARVDHPALKGWSAKDDMLFVQPPPAFLAQLVALRLHIDDCQHDDGALPGRSGRRHGHAPLVDSRIVKSDRHQPPARAALPVRPA